MSSGSEHDELLTELLVRALVDADIDARSVSMTEPRDPETDDKAQLVGTVFIACPRQDGFAAWVALAAEFRAALPHAVLATIAWLIRYITSHSTMIFIVYRIALGILLEDAAFVIAGLAIGTLGVTISIFLGAQATEFIGNLF